MGDTINAGFFSEDQGTGATAYGIYIAGGKNNLGPQATTVGSLIVIDAVGPSTIIGNSSLDPYSGGPLNTGDITLLNTRTWTGDLDSDNQMYGFRNNFTLNPSAANNGSVHAFTTAIGIPASNNKNLTNLYASEAIANHLGSGSIQTLYGSYVDAENQGPGHVLALYSHYTDIGDFTGAGGTIDTAYAYGVQFTNAGSTITDAYGFWEGDAAGTATNAYYSWFDSRGVRRIKEDGTFNSVGQAIEALYNPQFTKYTPGAANYERIILGQWSSNIGQIGIENGGTGTLRKLQLIGASLIGPVLPAADPHVVGEFYTTAGVVHQSTG